MFRKGDVSITAWKIIDRHLPRCHYGVMGLFWMNIYESYGVNTVYFCRGSDRDVVHSDFPVDALWSGEMRIYAKP